MEESKDFIENTEKNQLAEQQSAHAMAMKPDILDKNYFAMLGRAANMYSQSNIIPETYRRNPADCMIAIEMADRMNVSPLMVMQNLYVVKGKPSWSGQACMSLVQGCGKFEDAHHVYTGEAGTNGRACHLEAVRVSDGSRVVGPEVSIEMAKNEGWASNTKWKNMPELMLAYRAAAFFARVHCPEVLMGVQTMEEVEDSSPTKRIVEDPLK